MWILDGFRGSVESFAFIMTTTIAHDAPRVSTSPRLHELAFAAVAALLDSKDVGGGADLQFLLSHRQRIQQSGDEWGEALEMALRRPAPQDVRLVELGAALRLSVFEELTIALAVAVEEDPLAGRALARVQAPVGSSRPTLGLIALAFGSAVAPDDSAYSTLLDGPALQSGFLTLLNESAPLPERMVAVPPPLALALGGRPCAWPGVMIGFSESIVLAKSTRDEAARQAEALLAQTRAGLLLRAGLSVEARAVALEIARQVGRTPAFIESDKLTGMGPWLRLRNLLPVFVCENGPSERRVLPTLPGYDGPILALAGPEGGVESATGPLPVWILTVPPAREREILWLEALGPDAADLAGELAFNHRHGAGRIAQVGRLARQFASVRCARQSEEAPGLRNEDVIAASWTAAAGGLDSLAEPLRAPVPDNALVAPPALREQLEMLARRCRARDALIEGLGPAATTRYRPGLRALFTGPSGTGKTLAAGWLATRLELPIYRVDLASVTSKYIGETEKNLAQLLARAENAEVILLFDEADSLFGKRTDIRDSNDRFANAQTNYLLQRIENYDGIVLLTSNSRARFDSAFARRLDCVLEFNLPAPDERRDLWLAHLGDHHTLAPVQLNRIAALADLAGGYIRNAVLCAALLSRGQKITQVECVRGLQMEYRKIGRSLPGELENVLRINSKQPPQTNT
jgi:hypothetical protein